MSREGKQLIETLGLLYLGVGLYATVIGLKSASDNRKRQEKILADLAILKAALVRT